MVLVDDLPFTSNTDKGIQGRLDFLKGMYSYAKGKRGLVQVNTGPRLSKDFVTYKVKMETLGINLQGHYLPKKENEMQLMTIDVLSGLASLHKGGYLHCDIRLSNIVYDSNLNQYVIIDFEHGGRDGYIIDETSKWQSRSRSKHAATDQKNSSDIERLKEWDANTLDNGVYTQKSEMYQFWKLLHVNFNHLIESKEGMDFMEKLRTKRLAATEALQHKWVHKRVYFINLLIIY